MGLIKLFKRRPESPAVPVAEKQPEKPVKRDYKSVPGHYKPRTKYVRISNLARAAGVDVSVVRRYASRYDIEIIYVRERQHAVMAKNDAIIIHKEIWDEKA